MHQDVLRIETRAEEISPGEIHEHFDAVAAPLQAAREFHDLPLRAAGSEVVDDQQHSHATLESQA
jgi:hypothetical protein